MEVLLDTHALLWFMNGDEKLSASAREIIHNADNGIYISIASIWEIAIKFSIGKLTLKKGIENLLARVDENGFILLEIDTKHIKMVTELPFIHRDPFDRMLVAQAIVENMLVMTADENILKHDVSVIW